MKTQIISNEARKVLTFGLQNHWHFKVIGNGEPPKEPVYKNEWWFEPLTVQSIPSEGKGRLEALRRAGIRFQGTVVAHEAPKLLTVEKIEKKQDFKISPSSSILTVLGSIASAMILAWVLFFGFIFQAVLIDPALIVVLEDGTWVQVMSWYEG